MKNSLSAIALMFVISLCMMSCKPGVPKEYIQPGDMEDILFDYHIADGMANQSMKDRAVYQRAYRLAVLKKHEVTQAQFDSSMVYYMRHTDRLHTIYENLSKRLTEEAQSLGSSMGDMGGSYLSASGDTTNIWKGERSLLLVPQVPFSQYSYYVKADSSFHKGDAILLKFDAQFIYQDGMRDGLAVMSVRFSNDSVSSQVLHISSSTGFSLQIKDDKHLGVKEIRGFFMLNSGAGQNQSASATTLQIMSISDIKLVRMHENKNAGNTANPDSARMDSARKQLQTPNQTPMPSPAPNSAPVPPASSGGRMINANMPSMPPRNLPGGSPNTH